jgi:16S rRNA (cytosine967-C5)-methyltransferase
MAVAANALLSLQEGERLPAALVHSQQAVGLPAESNAAAQDMAYTAVRQAGLTAALVDLIVTRPPAAFTKAYLQVVLSQLIQGMRPAPIVVDQAVAMSRELQELSGQGAFINALLRRFLRDQANLTAKACEQPEALHNFPGWWIELLEAAYGQPLASNVMQVAQTPPPFTLRVNRRAGSASEYAAALNSQYSDSETPQAMAISGTQAVQAKAQDVHRLPGFANGDVSVQDLAAQLAVELLDVKAGHEVLDACAAPGGKTTHLLEFEPKRLVAADFDVKRITRVKQNLERYRPWGGLAVEVQRVDLKGYGKVYPNRFDRILLDAPCSASGVVRRHPDIRWLRRRGELATLVAEQKALLDSLWLCLKPGGKLLYATCSIFPEENDDVVRSFTDRCPEAQWLSLEAPIDGLHLVQGRSKSLRLLPSDGASSAHAQSQYAHDGFYMALLQKSV